MSTSPNARADALLGALQRQQAGRLTVYLGAAPGVGKTYAMLSRARDLQRQGTDVVVALVETHGRRDTEALLDGLTVMPRQVVSYRDKSLHELDLDAVLNRRPAIALVDELAHRNAPGSRHERRWQDIEELLDAGIDVHTTVNIQHLESLNDEVFGITGIRVTETVPDRLFERLRDIRLVDLPARELIERLSQGKVYLSDTASQALQAFFSPSNLSALRELAMQTVAAHVDVDLREALMARGRATTALQPHVVVGLDGQGQSAYLVRLAARLAERRGARWSAVVIDTGRALPAELDAAMALARRLGGDVEVVHHADVAQGLLDAAASRGARTLVIGRGPDRPLRRWLGRTITQRLIRRGGQHELVIAPLPAALRDSAPRRAGWRWSGLPWAETRRVLLAGLVATSVSALAERWMGLQDVSMVFLLAVLLVASVSSRSAAIAAALLCFLAYNFFFFEPRYTLYISAHQGTVTVMLFLAVALVASRLAARLREQVLALRAANLQATALQGLGKQLTQAADLGQVLQAGRAALQSVLQAEVWLRAGSMDAQAERGEAPEDKDQLAADWAQQHAQPCGRFTETLSASSWCFLPLLADAAVLGVVGIRFPDSLRRLLPEQRRLMEQMVNELAQAVVRTRLVAELEQARVLGETERLRSALLSSVSHDLRSPLAAMLGSAESLQRYGPMMSEQDRTELLNGIRLEGERLDRYIQNLLDMTRLGQHGLSLSRDWIGLDELIGSASRRLQRYQPGLQIEIQLEPELPPVQLHPALVEQALFNVLENAARYSPPGAAVEVAVRRLDGDRVQIDVSDQGPGIPPEERARIFDMFYSVERGDRGRQGTGLGLTIVQAIVGAHMGSVEALPGPRGRGTTLRIELPIGPQPTSREAHGQ